MHAMLWIYSSSGMPDPVFVWNVSKLLLLDLMGSNTVDLSHPALFWLFLMWSPPTKEAHGRSIMDIRPWQPYRIQQ